MSPFLARNQRQGSALSLEKILEALHECHPETVIGTSPNGARWIQVTSFALLDVARLLKADPRLRFEQLCCLTGVDLQKFPATPERPACDDLVCAYDLHSLVNGHSLLLKVQVPRANPELPSVESVWGVASFFEREIFDLFGVVFKGHHDLRRLLLPPDWVGHPMRKDYVYPRSYGGVELCREGQTFESGPYT